MAVADLVVVSPEPLCAESPLELLQGMLTPLNRFYIRNHFPIPQPPTELIVGGALSRLQTFRADDLRRLPRRRLTATLECAGNGRTFMKPPVAGEPWGLGAVSTAEWEGISLCSVLRRAGVKSAVKEILFTGADGFTRSLPLEAALQDEVLVVDTMNGQPLRTEHGSPFRLLVPGWYGMASVKWLVRIEAIHTPFQGHFQVERYVIGDRPVRGMQPRAVILSPPEGAILTPTEQSVHGVAWTGAAGVASVELADDGGQTWHSASLLGKQQKYAWREWQCRWRPRATGPASLMARATDLGGRRQPLEPVWNELGYCNNVAVPRQVCVRAS